MTQNQAGGVAPIRPQDAGRRSGHPRRSPTPPVSTLNEPRADLGGARQELLRLRAIAEGDAWATARLRALRAECRRAVGGWPGTLREARARVLRPLADELARRQMTPLTADEHEGVTRLAYSSARDAWNRQERDGGD